MLLQEKEPIHDDDTAGTLSERLRHKGAGLVLRTVQMIEAGNYAPAPQPTSTALYAGPKLFKRCARSTGSSPHRKSTQLHPRPLPYPAAWTRLGDKLCKIYLAHAANDANDAPPGGYRTDGKSLLHFRTADGWLAIDELQLEGKKRMTAGEFLRGNKM
jgi:methionyl-tRNA formyltransferase